MDRRKFLKNIISASALGTLIPLERLFGIETNHLGLPFGMNSCRPPVDLPLTNTDHFFILVSIDQGLDCTLGLDPKIHEGTDQSDIFIEYEPNKILGSSCYQFGPAAKALLPFKDQLLTINGLNMRRDAGHDALREHLAAGRGDGESALLPVEISKITEEGPLGVLANTGINTGTRKAVVTSMSEVLSLLDTNLSDLNAFRRLNESRASETQFGLSEKAFSSSLTSIGELIFRLQEYSFMGDQRDRFEARAVATALSFKTNLSKQAFLEIKKPGGQRLDLDTHSNHERNHLREQTRAWDAVGELFNIFKGISYGESSLFDHTTFMVITEFSRTPFLNASRGKDHNVLTNSVLLAGKNIQGGKSVGASRVISRHISPSQEAIHIGRAINYETGEIVYSKKDRNPHTGNIYLENVGATIAEIFGVKDTIQTISKSTKAIPGVAKV